MYQNLVIRAPEKDRRADFDTKQGAYRCRQSQSVSSVIGPVRIVETKCPFPRSLFVVGE